MMKTAIIIYTAQGHTVELARALKEGYESIRGTADIFKVEEPSATEDNEESMAPTEEDIPVATKEIFEDYEAFLFGIPAHLGSAPSEWASFWDKTGGTWAAGTLQGKFAGLFVSGGLYGGGEETVIKSSLSYLVHHGMIFVPLGYKNVFAELTALDEPHGGSAWGAGTLAGTDDQLQGPSELELRIARIQGKTFCETVSGTGDKGKSVDKTKEDEEDKLNENERDGEDEKRAEQGSSAMQEREKQSTPASKDKEDKTSKYSQLSCCTIS